MTYSIVGRDARSGHLGIAVQSHHLSVGGHVAVAEPGVGVLALQSFAPPRYGVSGLAYLRDRVAADVVLERLIADDGRAARRSQVAVLGVEGPPAVHTGEWCVAEVSHATDAWASAQANMTQSPDLAHRMLQAFERATGDLGARLLGALDAAEREGGDWRGQQAAALRVVSGTAEIGDEAIDLRVDDHPQALDELHRLYRLHGALQRMRNAFSLAREGNIDRAVAELDAAQEAYGPGNLEPLVWSGVLLLRAGDRKRARERIRHAIASDQGWAELVRRLPAAQMLPVSDHALDEVLGAASPGPFSVGGR